MLRWTYVYVQRKSTSMDRRFACTSVWTILGFDCAWYFVLLCEIRLKYEESRADPHRSEIQRSNSVKWKRNIHQIFVVDRSVSRLVSFPALWSGYLRSKSTYGDFSVLVSCGISAHQVSSPIALYIKLLLSQILSVKCTGFSAPPFYNRRSESKYCNSNIVLGDWALIRPLIVISRLVQWQYLWVRVRQLAQHTFLIYFAILRNFLALRCWNPSNRSSVVFGAPKNWEEWSYH